MGKSYDNGFAAFVFWFGWLDKTLPARTRAPWSDDDLRAKYN
jgi:hypothetical protein